MEMIGVLVARQDVFNEPGGERLAVFHSSLPEVEQPPDLGAMILDGAALPAIVRPRGRLDVDLPGDVPHHDLGDLLGMLREASFVLENFRRTAKPRRVGPVLLASHGFSLGSKVQCSINSSAVPIALHAASLLLQLGEAAALSPAGDREFAPNRAAVYLFAEKSKGEKKPAKNAARTNDRP